MAIVFLEQQQKQKYLIVILAAILLIIPLVLFKGFGFFSKKTTPAAVAPASVPKIEINFGLLKNPALQELQPFEPIKPFEGEIGRKNPFVLPAKPAK